MDTSHLIKKRQNKPDHTSPSERAKIAALRKNYSKHIAAVEWRFPGPRYYQFDPKNIRAPLSPRSSGDSENGGTRPGLHPLEKIAGRPEGYRPKGLFGPDSKHAPPDFDQKPIKLAHLKYTTNEEQVQYVASVLKDKDLNEPVEVPENEFHPRELIFPEAANKSSLADAETHEGDLMDLDEDVSAKAGGKDEVTDTRKQAISEIGVLPIASSQPQPSAEAASRHQEMSNATAKRIPALGMLDPSSNLNDVSKSSSASRNPATQAPSPAKAASSDHRMNEAPAEALPGLGMLRSETQPIQPPSIPVTSSEGVPGLGMLQSQIRAEQPSTSVISPASVPSPHWPAQVCNSNQRNGVSKYRGPALVGISFESGGDDTVSSVPGLSDELEERAFAPILSSALDQGMTDALCRSIAGMSLDDRKTSRKRPVGAFHGSVTARYKDDDPEDDSPRHAGSKRKMSDNLGLFPTSNQICSAPQSGTSADEPISKKRCISISGVHASLLAYQDDDSDEDSTTYSSSKSKTPDRSGPDSTANHATQSGSSAFHRKDAIDSSKAASSSAPKGDIRPPTQGAAELLNELKSLASAVTDSASLAKLTEALAMMRIDPAMASRKVESHLVSSPVESGQSIQSAGLVSTTFTQPKKPGTFGISNPRGSALVSTPASSSQLVQGVGLSSTPFAQSEKAGTFGVSNNKGSAVVSNPVSSDQPAQRADSMSTTFAQPKKPGTFGVSNNEGNAIVSNPISSRQPIQGVGSTFMTFVQSKCPGSFGVSSADGNVVPATPVFATSTSPDSAMELDEPQIAASKPLTPSRASVSMLSSNGAAPARPFVPSEAPSQTSAMHTSDTGKNVSKAQHIGRTRKDLRERIDGSRKEIEGQMHNVTEQFKIDMHRVIESPLCEAVPAASDAKVPSIPDLVKTGPEASVTALPCAQKLLSMVDIKRDLEYFPQN